MRMRVWRRDLTLHHTWRVAGGANRTTSPTVFVELVASDGSTGLGESAPSTRYGESAASSEELLRRLDPSRLSFDDLDSSRAYLDRVAARHPSARGAVEVALLDGAARREEVPLHEHLGLGFDEGAYRTSYSIGLGSADEVRRKVQEAATYPVLKMKVGGPNDRECLAALRSVAPETTVRVDANEAWRTPEEALRNLEWLAGDAHVELVEQPMPAAAPDESWRRLKERSPLPLIADESCVTADDVPRLADLVHGVNCKLAKTGGPIGALAVLRAAREHGLSTMIGCMIESSVLVSAAAHLASLADWLDLDGNLLVSDDPYRGVGSIGGRLSFAAAPARTGLCVAPTVSHSRIHRTVGS